MRYDISRKRVYDFLSIKRMESSHMEDAEIFGSKLGINLITILTISSFK